MNSPTSQEILSRCTPVAAGWWVAAAAAAHTQHGTGSGSAASNPQPPCTGVQVLRGHERMDGGLGMKETHGIRKRLCTNADPAAWAWLRQAAAQGLRAGSKQACARATRM